MSNKVVQQSLLQKKNKNNLDRLNSIINDYESKLDQRVNQVILEMINYTKKISDPPLLPAIRDKRMESQRQIDKTHVYNHRNKSSSQYSELSFLTDTSLESEVSQLRNTFKETQEKKVIEVGRSVGSHSIIKPKFVKRKPDIVPKQIRLNPLHQRNAIKAYELDRGVMSLIEKGKIGKDVNIITAFEKGRPVLQAQKAIFHQGEERFAELEGQVSKDQVSPEKGLPKMKTDKNEGRDRDRMFQDSWALTMPKEDVSNSKINTMVLEPERQVKAQPIQLTFKEQTYLRILHYKIQEDKSYKEVMNRHLSFKVEVIQVLQQLTKLMKAYCIEIGYVDIAQVMKLVTKLRKLSKNQLFTCIVGSNKSHLHSVKQVRGKEHKHKLALDKVISTLKSKVERKKFKKYLEKKKAANHIYGWAVSRWTVKKHRELIKQRRKQTDSEFQSLQKNFRQIYSSIEEKKHFEIHLINQELQHKEEYKDILNIQIIKIFNIKNINKHIIYLLPHPLDQETINYYYKIMELEEIPNYKERVTFLEADPEKQFKHSLTLTAKLYFNSKVLRKLKKKIKQTLAYFVVSYPQTLNIQLAVHLNIPILSGNLNTTLQIEKRTSLAKFNQETLQYLSVEASKHSTLFSLSDEISQYCQNNKRISKYVVKINSQNKSRGIALLSYPFASLPEMYSNTTLISRGTDIDTFYHWLQREGGIVEKYEEGLSFIAVILSISVDGTIRIIGTFEKISSGFINIAYIFPQKKIEYKVLSQMSLKVGQQLFKKEHFGNAQITFAVNDLQDIFLEKVQCYSTHLSSALDYYKFLSEGEFSENGDYLAKIVDTFQNEGKEEEVLTFEPRSFCYVPFLLHFGLSDRQANSFFQLCRMGGVSFDLQNKYGATFILLGSIKSSMGLITTAKDKRSASKLMLKSLQFIVKQNSHNMSNGTLVEKDVRMKQRENIINIKERLQHL